MEKDQLINELTLLERKIKLLLAEHKSMKDGLSQLKMENDKLRSIVKIKEEQIADFQNQNKISTIVDNVVAGGEDTTELKQYLNEYIREIDKCIAHLSNWSYNLYTMEELSIRIRIADREYPMKVSMDDEARIRKAGKLINEKTKEYQEQFGIDDKQDLLAMVAFDCLVEQIQSNAVNVDIDESVVNKVTYLNHIVSQVL